MELDSEPLVSTHTLCRDPDRYFGADLKDTMRVDGLGVQIPLIGGTARNGNDVHGAFDALCFFCCRSGLADERAVLCFRASHCPDAGSGAASFQATNTP